MRSINPKILGQNCAFIWLMHLMADEEAVAICVLDIPTKYTCPAFITWAGSCLTISTMFIFCMHCKYASAFCMHMT